MTAPAVPKIGLPPEALMEIPLGLLLISWDEKMHREHQGTLNATRYLPCEHQSCQLHSLRMAEEVLYVLAMANGTPHIFHLCLPCTLRSFKTAREVQMAYRGQEQEVNQVQTGAHMYARLRLPRVGKQAIEPPLLCFGSTLPPSSVLHLVRTFGLLSFSIMCSN